MSSTARDEVWTDMPVSGGEAASLVESAMLLRWRAPELALLLADRAVTAAQDDRMAVLRANHLAVFALNRLGRHAEAAHRLFPAIRDADTPAELRHQLHVELAHCAAALGEPVTALAAVRAVLVAGEDVPAVLRATALVAAAESSAALGRSDVVPSALEEADELYREDPSLDHDTALLLRGAARAADAARHRRSGAIADAEAQARAGRKLLVGLADPEHDSGELSARLMLEVVLALLDRGDGDAAMQEARPLLRRPVRAAAAGAVGMLRLTLATRVHLAEGRHEPALTLLADAVEGAQRHGVDAVLAECLEGLSHVHEVRGEFADALYCMRAARAAEGRHRHSVEAARYLLLQRCESQRREVADLVCQVAVLLCNTGAGGAGPHPEAGLPDAEISGGVAQHPVPEAVTPELATRKTDKPEVATIEVGEPEGGLVVGKPEAETPEADRPEAVAAGVEMSEAQAPEAQAPEVETSEFENSEAEAAAEPSAPVLPPPAAAQASATVVVDPVVEEAIVEVAQEAAEEHDLAPVLQEPAGLPSGEPRAGLDPWPSGARHRRGAGTLVSVSDLLPASALSAGRSGRRRAEERGDSGSTPPEDPSPARREFPTFGPPPAPTPRALDLEPGDEGSTDEGKSQQMGLGDLLAEALAAYQEGRPPTADDTGAIAGDVGAAADDAGATAADAESTAQSAVADHTAADAGAGRDAPGHRRLGRRWTSGLQLAPSPADRHEDDPSEALTNPLLRLPDLTAEPLWPPPRSGRRTAAGD